MCSFVIAGYPIFRSDNPGIRERDLYNIHDLDCSGTESVIDECFRGFNPFQTCDPENVLVVQCVGKFRLS